MDIKIKELNAVFRKASRGGVLEKVFREPVEAHLLELARQENIELVPHTEVTMGTSGRADTIYNRFIIEWEKPGSLKPSNSATKNTETIGQVKRYVESFWFSNRQAPGRVVGCCTDGHYFIFCTKPEREWQVSDPVAVDEQSCKKFLDYFFSLHSGIALLPEYLSEDFSADNIRTQRTVKTLYESLDKHSASPALSAIFEQWAQFYGEVTDYENWQTKLANEKQLRDMVKKFGIPQGSLDLNRFFFATHTFFAILTKLLAYIIVGRYTDLPTPPLPDWKGLNNAQLAEQFSELEKGGPFREAGIRNFLEGDFFAWYSRYFTPELAVCLRAVVERLSEYDAATLDLAPAPTQDMLKKLYHRLVSPMIRKALGEYYTPDWLAQRVLNMLDGGKFRGNPDTRLLDPTCGSGTFLLMAIRAIRNNSIAQSLEPDVLLRKICHNVVGIDLNPLAVIAARTNYLLALGPLLQHRGKEPLEIPIYLADSVMTPSRKDHDLFEREIVRVLLSIGKLEIPRRLATQKGVAILTDLFDHHLEKEPSTAPDHFLRYAKGPLLECYDEAMAKNDLDKKHLTPDEAWKVDAELIQRLYSALHALHAKGRNGLWARVLKNAFAPIFLAPFDYVVGNPPWIGWENLPEGYRNETKDLWHQHGLFVHSGMDTILGKGKKDISMLVTYVAADSYLKTGGKIGLVITQAVFKMAGAAQGFRRFQTRTGQPLRCLFVDDFSELQLFEGATNKTAVFIMQKGSPHRYPVSYTYWRKKESGRKGSFDYDATLEEVTSKTERKNWEAEPADNSDPTSAWLTGARGVVKTIKKVLGKSAYEAHEGVNSGGANAVYWFEILKDHGDGTVTARNVTETAKRKIESVQVQLEKDILLPMLRIQDLSAFKAQPKICFLFVQDPKKRHGIPEEVLKASHPLAYKWVCLQRQVLEKRSSQAIKTLMKNHAFYSIFSVGEYTVSPWKVVWSAVDTKLEAAVVSSYQGKTVISQHIVTLIALNNETEAHYVCGVVNSTPFRFAVSCFSQPGSKSFGTPSILEKARIPKFDSSLRLHREIAAESKRLSHCGKEATRPVYSELDRLCVKLWDITEIELNAVETAYRELYVTEAKSEVEGEDSETEE